MRLPEDLPALIEFNILPARYMHDSWFDQFRHGHMIYKLRACRRTEYKLSHYILECLGLSNSYCFDIPQPVSAVVLLPPAELVRMVRYLGACANVSMLQRLIGKKQVQSIKNAIGEDAYLFGIKRAPYLVAGSETPKLKSIMARNLGDYITICGMCLLFAAFKDSSLALKKRLSLKFSYHWIQMMSQPVLLSGASETHLLIERVRAEVIKS
ncbi:SctK family type III secretion system sorting platform protein [Exilibacterium tricleocarpae]|nr:SctK family type III secretion system sorting platform protein [Exilibacterium tricleocarpae]